MLLDTILLNLPSVVSQSGSTKATYTYLADGSKVQVADASGNGFAYLGSLIYTKSGSSYTLESSSFGGGRIVNSSGTLTTYYYTTDHLGSVRLVTNSGGAVAEQNDYFPFGGKHTSGQPYSTLAANRYKFNGKEEQTVGGLSYLDYGARMYDNVLDRWMTQDPLGEKYYGHSPYNYCLNNPGRFVDPDGRKVRISFKEKVGTGLISVQYMKNNLYTLDGRIYTGKNEYAIKVRNDLNQLRKEDETLAERITILENSIYVHTVSMPTSANKGNTNTPLSPYNDRHHIPTGSNTEYNPDKEITTGGEKRTPRVGLAHELLSHGYDSDQGKTDYRKTQNGIPMYEVNAVNIENKTRAKTGDPKRTKYGEIEIAKNLLYETHENNFF